MKCILGSPTPPPCLGVDNVQPGKTREKKKTQWSEENFDLC